MSDRCSSINGDETHEKLQQEFGNKFVTNTLGSKEDCTWEFTAPEDHFNYLVANVTEVDMTCGQDIFNIAGSEYCVTEETFCIFFPSTQCNDSIPGCDKVIHSEDESTILHVVTSIQDHGFSLGYHFYHCKELLSAVTSIATSIPVTNGGTKSRKFNYREETDDKTQEDESGNVVGILVPIMLLILILIFITCLYLFLKYRGKRRKVKKSEPVTIQQYISTVGADNYVMASDVAPGSNFTLQFARSYESVPRGTSEDPIPVYSMIHDISDNYARKGIEDRKYEEIRPVKQDVRRIKKSSDTSSISNINLSQETSYKPNVRPLYALPKKKQKPRTQPDGLSTGEMTQSLGDLTSITRLDHRKFSLEQPYQFADDVTEGASTSKNVPQPSVSYSTSNARDYHNFGFIDDSNFVSINY